MNKFDEIAKELGWTKPYKTVSLWYRNYKRDSEKLIAVFDINSTYDLFKNEIRLDEKYVKGSLNFFPQSIFEKANKKWILPLLSSDYFAHRGDFKNELIWAKKAMKQNKKLTPLQFSLQIREQL